MKIKLYNYPKNFVLCFFLSLMIIAVQLLLIVSNVMLNPKVYKNVVDKEDIVTTIHDNLNTYFERQSDATGIPAEVFMKSTTKTNILAAVNAIIDDSFGFMTDSDAAAPEIKYDFTQLDKDITEYVDNYADENNIEINDEYNSILKNTIDVAQSQIKSSLDVVLVYQISKMGIAATLHKNFGFVNIAVIVFVVVAVALFALLCRLQRHHKLEIMYWSGTALLASSGVLLVPTIYLKATGYFANFFVSKDDTYTIFTSVTDMVLMRIILIDAIIFVIGLLLVILMPYIIKSRIKKERIRNKKLSLQE